MRGKTLRVVQRISGVICLGVCAPAVADDRSDDYLVYTVQRGDTLYDLSRQYLMGASATQELGKLNAIKLPRRLRIGTQLRVPRALALHDPAPLRVIAFSGPVNVSHETTRMAMRTGLVIGEGTQIETGRNGFVSFQAMDGSKVTLPSNTRARLTMARRYRMYAVPEVEFAVERGRGEARAEKQTPQGQFRLRTPILVAAVRGTEFNVGHDDVAGTSTTEVNEGAVATATVANEVLVRAGNGVRAASDGTLLQAKLLPAPALIAPGKVQTDEQVAFDFSPVENGLHYRTQVARDASFLDIIAEVATDTAHAEFSELLNGTYFVRSAAIDSNGLHGSSTIQSFRRQRAGLKADIVQSALPGAYRFNWIVTGEGRSMFRFQLYAADRPDQPLIDEAGLQNPGLSLTGLARGAYRWRVCLILTAPEGKVEVWTPLQSFSVNN